MQRVLQRSRRSARSIAALACVLFSCARAQPTAAPATHAAPVALAPRIVWASADAEVWAWRVVVRGELIGQTTLQECRVELAGRTLPARTHARDFALEVALEPGENVLRARCRDQAGAELVSPELLYVEQLADVPVARAHAEVRDERLVLDGRASTPSEHSRAQLTEYAWFAPGADAEIGRGAERTLPLPEQDGDFVYTLRVRDARGATDTARVLVRVQDGAARVPESAYAARIDDAVVYGVLPPLYGAAPLSGVRAALDRLADLGVSVLWLAPLFATPPGDYGYAVTDFQRVRADYGSADDLEALVRDAHSRGLQVLLDLPANHSSDQHRWFVQAERLGARSHYFDFYARDADGAATHYFDWANLPNFDYDNTEVERFMLEVSSAWVRDFRLDGYRVDAAWGVRLRSPAFWPRWSDALRRIAPAALLIAEAPARDAYYVEHGFDAAYDWTDKVGQWAWQDVWSEPTGVAARLAAAVERGVEAERPGRVLRFLNNNDTGARFITRHGRDMTRVATAALLTLPGVPCLYSFDEVGAEFDPYSELAPLAPHDDEALYAWHRTLIHLRRATPALRGEGFLPFAVDAEREVYAYLRYDTSGSNVALVVLHFAAQPARVTLAMPQRFGQLHDARLRDALSGKTVRLHGNQLELMLAPWEAKVLLPDVSAFARAANPKQRLSSR